MINNLSTIFKGTWRHLSAKEKISIVANLIFRILISLLDLVGIALVGATTAMIAVPSSYKNFLPEFIDKALSALPGSSIMTVLACSAVLVFCLKSYASFYLNKRVILSMALLESGKATKLFRNLLDANLNQFKDWSKHQIGFGLAGSITAGFSTFYTAMMSIIVEVAMIISIAIYLGMVNPLLTLGTFGFLAAILLLINFSSGRTTSDLAKLNMNLSIMAGQRVYEALDNFRQFRVSRNFSHLETGYKESRVKASEIGAQMVVQNSAQRYLVEAVLILAIGFVLITSQVGDWLYLSTETIAVFATGAFRVLSSLLPIQASLNSVRQSIVDSRLALEMMERLPSMNLESAIGKVHLKPKSSTAVEFHDVSFTYDSDTRGVIRNCSFSLSSPDLVVITGRSGEGKSTLVDLMLGLRPATSGKICLFGGKPLDYIDHNPDAVAYVPQESYLIEGTLLENVTLGTRENVDMNRLQSAIREADLVEFIESLPEGFETKVSGQFSKLSGGQVQRLSLARALYRNPRILILDEPTSALDEETEKSILKALNTLSKTKLVILISHSHASGKLPKTKLLVKNKKVILEGRP